MVRGEPGALPERRARPDGGAARRPQRSLRRQEDSTEGGGQALDLPHPSRRALRQGQEPLQDPLRGDADPLRGQDGAGPALSAHRSGRLLRGGRLPHAGAGGARPGCVRRSPPSRRRFKAVETALAKGKLALDQRVSAQPRSARLRGAEGRAARRRRPPEILPRRGAPVARPRSGAPSSPSGSSTSPSAPVRCSISAGRRSTERLPVLPD